jgi:2-polyprenyl-6-methoxyphenol hydroxylase-like FAD-dependent oxidoreductase
MAPSPTGAISYHQRGVLDAIAQAGTPAVRSTTFHYADTVIPVELKPRDGIDGLYAPRRFVIDTVLVDAAEAAGGEVVFGVQVTDIKRTDDRRVCGVVAKPTDGVDTVEISAGLVIGADGRHSTIAGLVDASAYHKAEYTTAVLFNYFADIGFDGYQWYYRLYKEQTVRV